MVTLSRLLLSVFFSCVALSAPALADVYRYTDDAGEAHYVDSIKKVPEKYKASVRFANNLPKLSKTPAVQYDQKSAEHAATRPPVEIYVAEWCGYCRALESFLKQHSVRYKRFDVENSEQGRVVYAEHQSVPISIIGKTVVVGFEPNRFKSLLNIEAN